MNWNPLVFLNNNNNQLQNSDFNRAMKLFFAITPLSCSTNDSMKLNMNVIEEKNFSHHAFIMGPRADIPEACLRIKWKCFNFNSASGFKHSRRRPGHFSIISKRGFCHDSHTWKPISTIKKEMTSGKILSHDIFN